VEIAGPQRTSRWWFVPGRFEVTIEIEDEAGKRNHRLAVEPPRAPARYRAQER
jgi:hypothetical protein